MHSTALDYRTENFFSKAHIELKAQLLGPKLMNVLFITRDEVLSIDHRLTNVINFSYEEFENLNQLHRLRRCDLILVSSDLANEFGKYLDKLLSYGLNHGTPIVLYSTAFYRLGQNTAKTFGFDDYYFGPINKNFKKKIQFYKLLKKHKCNHKKHPKLSVGHYYLHQKINWAMRCMDIALSSLLLLMISPLLLLIALIIKIESRGPIFYISKRAGFGYKVFDFYKFRSMRKDADKEMSRLREHNQYGNSAFFKMRNDPRITKFGAFLRTTSLDELPQLFNVLKGDMSLVGNRPLPLYEAEHMTKDIAAGRFLAPAGITGLWQITKRGKHDVTEEERIQLDLNYARNHSLWLNLKILLHTFPALMQKEPV